MGALFIFTLFLGVCGEGLLDDGCFVSAGTKYCPVCVEYAPDGFCSRYDNREKTDDSPSPSSTNHLKNSVSESSEAANMTGPGIYGRYCFTSGADGKQHCPKCVELGGKPGEEYCLRFSYADVGATVPPKDTPLQTTDPAASCAEEQQLCTSVAGLPFVPFKPCCKLSDKLEKADDVVLECLDVDVLGPAKYCVPAKQGSSVDCTPNLNRCAGAAKMPFVPYKPCCSNAHVCVEDASLGWGRFCKPKN